RVTAPLARGQRALLALVPHRDPVGARDGAELAWRATGCRHPLLHRLGLAHQRDIAGRSLVPAARHADEGLVDLRGGQTHGVIVGPMGGALRTLGDVPTWQPVLEICLGVARERLAPAA